MANRHAPGGISGSKVSAIPDSNGNGQPDHPEHHLFSRVCHHGPLRLDRAAVSPLTRNSRDALGP